MLLNCNPKFFVSFLINAKIKASALLNYLCEGRRYRVYQSEIDETKWLWGIEGSIFFFKLGCLVASGGLDIWVSSTCFQKTNIDRPQQPPTEKVLKFNMTFHDSTKKLFSQNIKIKLNLRIWMTEVLSRDFPVLRTSAASMTSTTSMASMTLKASFHQKVYWLMVGSSLAAKWPIPAPFCGVNYRLVNYQNSIFSLIYDTFSVGGCWGQPMLIFLNQIEETEMSKPSKATTHH